MAAKRGAGEVHLAHGLRRQSMMLWLEQRFFLRGGQHTDPQRFGEIQFAARLRSAVFLDALGGHHAGDRQTEDRLRSVNGMAACQRDPGLLAGKAPALDHFTGNFRRRVLIGQPRMAIAIIGFPPMAKISLMALVAAMRPKSNGLSTIGIKKSVVLTIDVPLPRS